MNRCLPMLMLVLASACADPAPITETVVVLRAERSVALRTTHVRVVVSSRDASTNAFVERERRTLVLDGDTTRFPLLLTLTPEAGDATRVFRVEAVALEGEPNGSVVSRATIEAGFVKDSTRVAELMLDAGCAGVTCGASETCLASTCVPANADLSDPGDVIDRCEYDNGGCDPVVSCERDGAHARCGACPAGYIARSATDCALDDASIVSLTSSAGHVEPFDADASAITVLLFADTTSVMLRAHAREPGAATIAWAGTVVPSGAPSQTIATPLGTTDVTVAVTTETGATRTYVVHLVRAIELSAYVKAPVPMRDALFASTALSGDTLVVGAPRENVRLPSGTTITRAGAVHVYRRGADGTITFEQTLVASNAGASDEFGSDVQIDGDRMIVSSPYEDSSATTVNGNANDEGLTDSGALYVFERTGRVWTEVAYLKVPATEAGRTLGFVIALHGNTIVAGTGLDDGAAGDIPNSGAAYVFERRDTGYVLATVLRAPIPHVEDRFGATVDLDASTIIVGAAQEDGGSTDANFDCGAAYVFTRATNGQWVSSAYLRSTHPGAGDHFGSGVAVAGDVIAVGARFEDSNSTAASPDPSIDGLSDSGGVFVFMRSGPVWSPTTFLKASNPGASDRFGNAVALDGGILLVGAPGEDGGGSGVDPEASESGTDSGAVYAFVRQGSTFVLEAYLKAEENDAGDLFAALSVDAGRIFIGSRLEDGNGQSSADDSLLDSGAAYLFE